MFWLWISNGWLPPPPAPAAASLRASASSTTSSGLGSPSLAPSAASLSSPRTNNDSSSASWAWLAGGLDVGRCTADGGVGGSIPTSKRLVGCSLTFTIGGCYGCIFCRFGCRLIDSLPIRPSWGHHNTTKVRILLIVSFKLSRRSGSVLCCCATPNSAYDKTLTSSGFSATLNHMMSKVF